MSYKYDYTRLLVEDFAACFLFYRNVLGLEPFMGTEDDVYAEFKTGETTLALFRRGDKPFSLFMWVFTWGRRKQKQILISTDMDR